MSDSPLNVMHRRTRIAPVVLCALAIVNLFLLTATEVRAQDNVACKAGAATVK